MTPSPITGRFASIHETLTVSDAATVVLSQPYRTTSRVVVCAAAAGRARASSTTSAASMIPVRPFVMQTRTRSPALNDSGLSRESIKYT